MNADQSVPHLDLAPKLKRPLQLWNPLDYLRLFYWVFFFPQALRWYVETFTNRRSRRATMVFQNLLLSLLLATVLPTLVRAIYPHKMLNDLVLITVGGVCTVLVWALVTGSDLTTGTRTGVRISALVGFILCVESALLPYEMLVSIHP